MKKLFKKTKKSTKETNQKLNKKRNDVLKKENLPDRFWHNTQNCFVCILKQLSQQSNHEQQLRTEIYFY